MADISTTRIFTDGERGITAAKLNDIVASSAIQPAFYTSKPVGSTADPADIALILKAGAYTQVPISTLAGSTTQGQIWSTRLRSYNLVGNCNFEVDQPNVGGTVTNIGNGIRAVDRWFYNKTGTMTVNTVQGVENVVVPSTSFNITSKFLRVTLTGQESALGINDFFALYQLIEGPCMRELLGDAHSASLLVRSSVAGLKFGYGIYDSALSKALCKLCTIPSANTWTLIQLPNLPVFPGGNWTTAPGTAGQIIRIVLGAGTSVTVAANDTWQSTTTQIGAVGQSNFAASLINSTFDIAVVQHEPGGACSTLMDLPFSTNLDQCMRYYQKTYSYGVKPGTIDINGSFALLPATGSAFGPSRFLKVMAKAPTLTAWSPDSALLNSVRDTNGGVDRPVTSFNGIGDSGFRYIAATGVVAAAGQACYIHYTADAGW